MAVLTIAQITYQFVKVFKNRLHTRRIEEPTDLDLEAALLLEENEFGENVVEDIDDCRRWLSEQKNEKKLHKNKWDEYQIIVKHNMAVIATLYASYGIKAKLLFLSYIVIDHTSEAALHYGREKLICELLRCLRRDRHRWEGIVGEVEELKLDKKTDKAKMHAVQVMDNFQTQIKRLFKKDSTFVQRSFSRKGRWGREEPVPQVVNCWWARP